MAISRYKNVSTNGGKYYSTSEFPTKDKLESIATIRIRAAQFDRLDNLAFKHLGSGEYWWVIALMNDISWAFAIEEGRILKIPVDVQDVLKLM